MRMRIKYPFLLPALIAGLGLILAGRVTAQIFTTLHGFTAESYDYSIGAETNSDGAEPESGLVLSGNTLYGTAYDGGSSGYGTVFSLSLPVQPQLAIMLSGTNVILTWQTNAAGFTLQSTTNLSPAAWTTNLPAPVVINRQNTVTNLISGTQKFYRLSQ